MMAKDIVVDVLVDDKTPEVDVETSNRIVSEIKPILHDETLVGDGLESPMGVNTEVVATKEDLANKADKSTTLSGYGITDAYTKAETDAKIGAVYHVKGSVADYDSLPDDATIGDVYNLLDTGANYVWTEGGWDKLSETVDLSNYATKDDLENIELLPDQTDNAGKFLTTDGTTPSWSDKPLVNKPNDKQYSLVITPDYNSNYGSYNVAIGAGITAARSFGVHIGYQSMDTTTTGYSVGVGYYTRTNAYAIAIGYKAEGNARYSIQLGQGTNNDANTFKVANESGNFEIMSADGTIPAARHAALPTEDGTYVLKCVISGGVPTMSWVKE